MAENGRVLIICIFLFPLTILPRQQVRSYRLPNSSVWGKCFISSTFLFMYLSVFVAMRNRHKMQFVFTSFYSIPAQLCHYMDNSLDTQKKNKKRGKQLTPPLKSNKNLWRYRVDCWLQNLYTCLYMYVSLLIHFVKKTNTRKYTKIITMNLILYPFLFFFSGMNVEKFILIK